jgi:hypothetical protein
MYTHSVSRVTDNDHKLMGKILLFRSRNEWRRRNPAGTFEIKGEWKSWLANHAHYAFRVSL